MKYLKGRRGKQYAKRQKDKKVNPFYTSQAWRNCRQAFIYHDGGRCASCGDFPEGKNLHVDHITPISEGGAAFDFENLQVLCRACHARKTLKETGHNS